MRCCRGGDKARSSVYVVEGRLFEHLGKLPRNAGYPPLPLRLPFLFVAAKPAKRKDECRVRALQSERNNPLLITLYILRCRRDLFRGESKRQEGKSRCLLRYARRQCPFRWRSHSSTLAVAAGNKGTAAVAAAQRRR